MAKRHMMLLFGSFNPIHRGHTALAEYAIERGLCDEVAMIISPQNPFKQNMTLASEMDRYAMVELACKATRYPEHIHASVVEFLLEKPSYTINTLRYLEENNGHEMRFSIMMGSDLINTLPEWREAEAIIAGYDIYVYPRPNEELRYRTPRTTYLADAPQCDFSSTDVRHRLESGEDVGRMLDGDVIKYIRERGLWSIEGKIERLTTLIEQGATAEHHIERGKCHYRRNEWGKAINDLRRAEELDAECVEAKQWRTMTEEILEYRYKDIYNP